MQTLPRSAAMSMAFTLLTALAFSNSAAAVSPDRFQVDSVAGLRSAFNQANHDGGGEIILAAGTYKLDEGELLASAPITLEGAGAASTVLDGGAANRLLHVAGPDAALSLSGVTVAHGAEKSSGGGILAENGPLIVRDSVLSDNAAEIYGGALATSPSSPVSMTLVGVTISSNRALFGGGIAFVADAALETKLAAPAQPVNRGAQVLAVEASTIQGNGTAVGGLGGGIYQAGGTATLSDSTLTANTSAGGGAMFAAFGVSSFRNDTMTQNAVTGAPGLLASSTSAGGALLNVSGQVNLVNVTMDRDSGGSGAEIANVAMDLLHEGSSVRPQTSLVNTIVAGTQPANECSGLPLDSQGHNLGSDNSCELNQKGDQSGTEPRLAVLAANGGPTNTQALMSGSPAIDAADGKVCPATDQRGVARGANACDIGAFEFVAARPPQPRPVPQGAVQASVGLPDTGAERANPETASAAPLLAAVLVLAAMVLPRRWRVR